MKLIKLRKLPRGPSKLPWYWSQPKFGKRREGVILGLRWNCQGNILQLSTLWPYHSPLGHDWGKGAEVSRLLPHRPRRLSPCGACNESGSTERCMAHLLQGFAGAPPSGSPEHRGSLWKESATNTLLHVTNPRHPWHQQELRPQTLPPRANPPVAICAGLCVLNSSSKL